MKKLFLAYQWYKSDNWYGQNYRAILSVKENQGFKTKSEIQKFKTKFKNYVNRRFTQFKLTAKVKDLKIGKATDFPTYVHCSNGPSYSCQEFKITIDDLKEGDKND